MSASPLTVRTQIFLNGPKDWDEWILLLKHAALKDNIWEFIDPDTLKDKLPKLVELIEPTPASIRAM